MKNDYVLMAFLIVLAVCLVLEIIFHPLVASAQTTTQYDASLCDDNVYLPCPGRPVKTVIMTTDQYRALYAPAPSVATATIATTTPAKPTLADLLAEIAKLEALLKEVENAN